MTRNAVHDPLIDEVTAYVREYMSHYDPSHDFRHIQRVVHLAMLIQADASSPPTSRPVVHLAALMHDVGDKKYLKPEEDASTLVASVLTSLGADSELAQTVQTICLSVSYSSEVKDPAHVARLIERHPELAVVQDADRLDAIGAVGIGRAFTFGGAKSRDLSNTMEHFDDKLVRLEGMMKTARGREMAVERAQRLRLMQTWWKEETQGIETN
ncbi:HD domain-containingprotein [Emericellopsis cladophorae]|uniref:HD domain-containingprotein n=1 Tax=Emericellopsis cladophorae TaxID=2686198 RepID=A0A9P9Y7S2_9HYPO|nr:HD domain-containingprotein [Emericellopsis cladophorae]KAI6784379.1 HD domain-containingprotein [Emericellopsis cladophorae]